MRTPLPPLPKQQNLVLAPPSPANPNGPTPPSLKSNGPTRPSLKSQLHRATKKRMAFKAAAAAAPRAIVAPARAPYPASPPAASASGSAGAAPPTARALRGMSEPLPASGPARPAHL